MSLIRCIAVWALLLAALPVHADLEAGVDAVARRDFAAAFKAFKPLAAEGDVAAQVNLGNLYMKGFGVKQNYGEAARWYRNAAEKDEPMAQSKLGILYYYGLGVPQDYAEAGRWFIKAADRGDRGAQTVLASLYALGEGLPRDYVKAYYWYTLAAEQGSEDALAGRSSIADEMTPAQMDEVLRLLSETRRRVEKEEEQALERVGSGAETGTEQPTGITDTGFAVTGGKAGTKKRVPTQNPGRTDAKNKNTGNH
jgi:TPR repeat protein